MTIHHGDCLDIMRTMDDDSVDLIMTSPPYAMQRKKQYGGIPEDEYVDWWMPRAEQMRRILKPTGSLVVNIKEHVKDRQRSLYVDDVKAAMVRRGGWLWVEEYIWYKTNSAPGYGNSKLLRNAWEHVYQFTKSTAFKFNKNAVAKPKSEQRRMLERQQAEVDDRTTYRLTGSGVNFNPVYLAKQDKIYPDNVIIGPNVMSGYTIAHPAMFPEYLPSWFIRLLTDHGDTVLDPFSGSGTTVRAARKLNRVGIGIEINDKYITGGEMEAYLG